MIALPPWVRVYLACGITDIRKGMVCLPMLVQQSLYEDAFSGALYAFRGHRAGLIKRQCQVNRFWNEFAQFRACPERIGDFFGPSWLR